MAENNILLRISLVGNTEVQNSFNELKKQISENNTLLSKYNRTITEYEARQTAGLTATKRQTTVYQEAQTMVSSLTAKNNTLSGSYDVLKAAIDAEAQKSAQANNEFKEYVKSQTAVDTNLKLLANDFKEQADAAEKEAAAQAKLDAQNEKSRLAEEKALTLANQKKLSEENKLALNDKLEQSQSKLAASTEGESTVRGQNTNTIIQNNVATNALLKQKRLEATSTNEQVGAYDRLVAESTMANIALLDMAASGIKSGDAFDQAKIKADLLSKKVNELHATTGQYGKSANNAYYQTFQLTQVMRELPNFAISTRIGLMSISNNLPMLMQGFNELARSTVTVADANGVLTTKVLGNIGALKMFAKSLLSMNTLLIVGTTLMMLMSNEKTMKWVKDLFRGKEATDALSASMNVLNKSIKDNNGTLNSTVSKQKELGVVLNLAKEGTIDADSAVKLYNDTLGIHYGKVNNLDEAYRGYQENSRNFITATINQMAALQLMDETSAMVIKNQQLRLKNTKLANSEELESQYQTVYNLAKSQKGGLEELTKEMADATNWWLGKAGTGIGKYGEQLTSIIEVKGGKAFLKNMVAISKNEAVIKQTTETASGLIEKSKDLYNTIEQEPKTKGQDTLVDSYNTLGAALRETQIELENLASKEEQYGVKNPYDKRLEAADAWLKNEKLIIAEELSDQNLIITETNKNEKASKLETLKNSKDKIEAKKQYDNGIKVLDANTAIALQKNQDDAIAKEHDAERKRKDWIFSIKKDETDFRKQTLDEQTVNVLDNIEEEKNASLKAENDRYDALSSTAKTNKKREQLQKENTVNLLKIEEEYVQKVREIELQALKDKLSLDNQTDTERENLQKQVNKKELDNKIAHNKASQNIEEASAKESISKTKFTEEQKNQIRDEAINTALSVLNSYYDYALDQVDNEYNKTVDSLDKTKDAQEKKLDEQHDNGILSDKEYNTKKESIQAEYDAKKEEADKMAFEKEKKIKIKQALMELALGIVKTMASNPFPLNVVLSGLLTISSMANIATISAQQYAEGGKVKLRNIPIQKNGDDVLATVKTDEVVLTKEHQKALGGDATFKRIGVPGFANGGIIKPYRSTSIPQQISTVQSIEDILSRQSQIIFDTVIRYTNEKLSTLKVSVLESDITESQYNVKSRVSRSTLL